MLNNSLYGQAFCKVIMFFPSSIQTVSEISQKVEYVIIKTYDSMFLCNRQCKRNLVWSISLPIHNKLHSKIVKHVLSLQYSNVNFASFMYCCAANKYEWYSELLFMFLYMNILLFWLMWVCSRDCSSLSALIIIFMSFLTLGENPCNSTYIMVLLTWGIDVKFS